MVAKILDGLALAAEIRNSIRSRVLVLAGQYRAPGLAVILVGTDPASEVYVRNKVKACEAAGIRSWLTQRAAHVSQAEVIEAIEAFNADPAVDGILVQLPLPEHIDAHRVIEAIAAEKDVDGLKMISAGALLTGQDGFVPCTPLGIMRMLDHTGADLAGCEAVVVGRSASVGKPVALLLLERNASVTICHSKTANLAAQTRRADVLVAAVGRANLVTQSMVKPGAIVIDVGINRIDGNFAAMSNSVQSVKPPAGSLPYQAVLDR